MLSCIGSGVGFTESAITPAEGQIITGTHNFDNGISGGAIRGYVNFQVNDANLTADNTIVAMFTAGKTVDITNSIINTTGKNVIYITAGNMNLQNSEIAGGQGLDILNGSSSTMEGTTITTVAQKAGSLSTGVYVHDNSNIIFKGQNTVDVMAGVGARTEAILLQYTAKATNNGILNLYTGGDCGIEINYGSLFTNATNGTLTINKNTGKGVGPYGIYIKPNSNEQNGFIAESGSKTNINLNDDVANQIGIGVFDSKGFATLDGDINIVSTSSNATPSSPSKELQESIGIYQNNGSTITGGGTTTIDMWGTTGTGIRMEDAATSANYGELIITAAGETVGANISGSTFTVNKGKITTDKGNALNIMGGATANLRNIEIESTSTNTGSLGTSGKGNGIAVTGSSVNLSGANSVTTNSAYAPGINLDAASLLNVTSGTLAIMTSGVGGGTENSASGLNILNGSTANLSAGSTTSITTTSDNNTNASADGICLVGTGSTLNSNGILNITTAGNMAEGIEATGAGVVTNLSGTTTINTAKAIGTLIDKNSILNLNGTTTINAASNMGALIENDSTLNLNGNTTINAAGHGIRVASNAQIIAGAYAQTTVNISGNDMSGIYLNDNDTSFKDAVSGITNINLAGSNQNGFRVENNATGNFAGILNIKDTTGATGNTGIAVVGTTGIANLTNTGVTNISLNSGGIGVNVSGSNAKAALGEATIVADTVLQVADSGQLDVNVAGGKNVKLTGDLIGDSATTGGIMQVNLDNASSFLTGKATNNNQTINLTLSNAALWNVTGDSTLSLVDNSNAIINMLHTGSGIYETVTTNDYTGSGGTLKLGTDLDSQIYGDKLVINNASSAASGVIQVEDKSLFLNKEITGERHLLLVVDPSGKTTWTGVGLDTGGLWDVTPTVERGDSFGLANTNWYLRKMTKTPNIKVNDLLGTFDAGYGVWRSALTDDTLRKRLGNLRNVEEEEGIWARVKAGKLAASNYDSSYQMYQIGYDKKASQDTYYGLAVDHTRFSNSYKSGKGTGTLTDLSIYATSYHKSGAYSDFVLKAGQLKNDMDTHSTVNDSLNYNTWAYSASYETGKTYTNNNGWYVEPEVQLTYGYMRGGNYVSHTGVNLSVDTTKSLIGRAGLVLGRKTSKHEEYYAKVNAYREFTGSRNANLSAVNHYGFMESGVFNEGHRDVWFEAGLGGTAKLSRKTYVYGDVLKTFGADIQKKWQINAGVRWEF